MPKMEKPTEHKQRIYSALINFHIRQITDLSGEVGGASNEVTTFRESADMFHSLASPDKGLNDPLAYEAANIRFNCDRIEEYQQFILNLSYGGNGDYTPKISVLRDVLYLDDHTHYTFINKQIRYKDISIFQVLKILYDAHKISRIDYKQSIKRLNYKKTITFNPYYNYGYFILSMDIPTPHALKRHVREHISRYYTTIKSRASHNSIEGIGRKITLKRGWDNPDKCMAYYPATDTVRLRDNYQQLREYERIDHKKQTYMVAVKTYYSTHEYINRKRKDTNRLAEMNVKIYNEFLTRFDNSNKVTSAEMPQNRTNPKK